MAACLTRADQRSGAVVHLDLWVMRAAEELQCVTCPATSCFHCCVATEATHSLLTDTQIL